MRGWKVLTHDFRPPLQGGEPVFDGHTFPTTLPTVACDSSRLECSFGWNFTRNISTGLRLAGMWVTGRPSSVFEVEAADALERGNKMRAHSLTILRPATPNEIHLAIIESSASFGAHAVSMAEEQWLWYQALGRPLHNRGLVIAGLNAALVARGLTWTLKEFKDARDAWSARDAWAARDAWSDRDAWAAWDAWAARDAWAALSAWLAWPAWAARATTRDAWDDAWDAWAALVLQFSARSGWVALKHERLTIGVRDAYHHGLAIALPTGSNELGFAMEPPL